jgi:FkbM family methyltransferase
MLLDLEALLVDRHIVPRGVLHIGAHLGEELDVYRRLGIRNVVLVEAQPLLAAQLHSQARGFDDYRVFAVAAGNHHGTATMYTETANGSQSSSLLRPKKHVDQYPHIVFDGQITVVVAPLGEFLPDAGVDLGQYNLINMDIQGYELPALLGLGDRLRGFDAILVEVNRDELYEGCTRVEELDGYLGTFGFDRVETNWAGGTWGDAFYTRTSPSLEGAGWADIAMGQA